MDYKDTCKSLLNKIEEWRQWNGLISFDMKAELRTFLPDNGHYLCCNLLLVHRESTRDQNGPSISTELFFSIFSSFSCSPSTSHTTNASLSSPHIFFHLLAIQTYATVPTLNTTSNSHHAHAACFMCMLFIRRV